MQNKYTVLILVYLMGIEDTFLDCYAKIKIETFLYMVDLCMH